MAIFGLLESQVEFPFLVLHGLNVVLKTQEWGDPLRLFREYEILFLNKIRKNKSLSYLYARAPCLSIFLYYIKLHIHDFLRDRAASPPLQSRILATFANQQTKPAEHYSIGE